MAEMRAHSDPVAISNMQRRRAALCVCEHLGAAAGQVLLALGLIRRQQEQLVLVQDELDDQRVMALPPPFVGGGDR